MRVIFTINTVIEQLNFICGNQHVSSMFLFVTDKILQNTIKLPVKNYAKISSSKYTWS